MTISTISILSIFVKFIDAPPAAFRVDFLVNHNDDALLYMLRVAHTSNALVAEAKHVLWALYGAMFLGVMLKALVLIEHDIDTMIGKNHVHHII